jgi:CheY-like chemotaxis protein
LPITSTAPPYALILLVEDNATNSQILGDYLEAKGYRVELAWTGVEAVARTRELHPDIILIDLEGIV